MSAVTILLIIALYFGFLFAISAITSRNANEKTFFTGDKSSPWYVVAFGMIGASLSGVTFISVPGWVATTQFDYMQMVLGYLVGYTFIALVLLPVYYKMNLTSIYTYLEDRFGFYSYKTGAAFFLLSRTIGASFRLYLVAIVFQLILEKLDFVEIPFSVTVFLSILLIYLYTFRGGIKTVVWTDTLQTLFMLLSAVLSIWWISSELGWNFTEMVSEVSQSQYSKVFFFEDLGSKQYFWKKFLAGAFIAIVMTGLDQDMMQKNLTCRNLKDAQKNMFSFSIVLIVVNLGFLALGAMLYMYGAKSGITLEQLVDGKLQLFIKDVSTGEFIPRGGDELFPILAIDYFPGWVTAFFVLGLIAAAYSSADSALASLTTSFCIDFLNFDQREATENKTHIRYSVHIGFSLIIFATILIFSALQDESIISKIFKFAGYTYGPLLGLYFFGLFTRWTLHDRFVPVVCILAPIVSAILNEFAPAWFGFSFGFELLIINGGITFLGLMLLKKTKEKE